MARAALRACRLVKTPPNPLKGVQGIPFGDCLDLRDTLRLPAEGRSPSALPFLGTLLQVLAISYRSVLGIDL